MPQKLERLRIVTRKPPVSSQPVVVTAITASRVQAEIRFMSSILEQGNYRSTRAGRYACLKPQAFVLSTRNGTQLVKIFRFQGLVRLVKLGTPSADAELSQGRYPGKSEGVCKIGWFHATSSLEYASSGKGRVVWPTRVSPVTRCSAVEK